MSIDLTQQALNALADAGLGNDSPAEAYVIGYTQGHDDALALAIQLERSINRRPFMPDEAERLAMRLHEQVGDCPIAHESGKAMDDDEPIRTPIYAARSARYTVCPECGAWLDLKRVRLEYLRSAGLMHITRTQADAARWVRENTGVSVTGKDLANWRSRGKMPSTRRIDRHYWEWNIMDLLACAQDRAERDGGDV